MSSKSNLVVLASGGTHAGNSNSSQGIADTIADFLKQEGSQPQTSSSEIDNQSLRRLSFGERACPEMSTHKYEQFYQDVDERMSRNSLEYPDQQAHAQYWINSPSNGSSELLNEIDAFPGNVIGIRGYPKSGSNIESNKKLQVEYRRLQRDHDRLKMDWLSLVAKRSQDRTRELHNQSVQCNENELKQISVSPNDGIDETVKRLRMEVVEAEQRERDMARASHLKETQLNEAKLDVERLNHELDAMKTRAKTMDFGEPYTSLRNQNAALRTEMAQDKKNLTRLGEKLRDLEAKSTSLEEEQSRLEKEKNEEISRLMVELCRLQVYQPKLELLLDTERKIKCELELKLAAFEADKSKLLDENERLRSDLNCEKMRSRSNESIEQNRLLVELKRLEEKCTLKERDRDHLEELLRSAKSRLVSMDTKQQLDLESARAMSLGELESLRANLLQVTEERDRCSMKLSQMEQKLTQFGVEKTKIQGELIELSRQLEICKSGRELEAEKVKLLADRDKQVSELVMRRRQLELQVEELGDQLVAAKRDRERTRQQVDQLQQRFQLQQQSLLELRAKKDKELARLRASLNFEQYNRQVALKAIEKELRASLRDLEAMKCRFSQRFQPVSSLCRPAKASSSSSPSCSSSNTKKTPPSTSSPPLSKTYKSTGIRRSSGVVVAGAKKTSSIGSLAATNNEAQLG